MIKDLIKKRYSSLLNEYHQWRYWDSVTKMMKKGENENVPHQQSTIYKPGIVLSFDDSFRVGHWYKYSKDLFGYYDVKVTFNMNAFHHFEGKREHSQKEIDMLLDLQANGHEIAHHGFKHQRATLYSKDHGVDKWIEDEIIDLFDWMEMQSHSITKEKFKRPVTYAFPHFVFEEKYIKALVPKYFKVVRGHYEGDHLFAFNHTGLVPSICIDRHILSANRNIKKILKMAKQSGKNIILTCHSILPDSVQWDDFNWGTKAESAGNWRISPKTLQLIINEARKMDMPFYTTSEAAGVATFIDRNFENCVRKQLKNPLTKWITINKLHSIKTLNISNQNIMNLDGIQYFQNLESLDLSHNQISDFRLLDSLPKLNDIRK